MFSFRGGHEFFLKINIGKLWSQMGFKDNSKLHYLYENVFFKNYESSYSEESKSSEANTSVFYDAESGTNTMRLSPVAATENSADYTIVPSTENNSESSSIDSLSSEDVECSLSSNDNQSLRGAQGIC